MTALNAVERIEAEEAYLSVERLIRAISRQFSRRYNTDAEDTFGEACRGFCHKWPRYDPSRSALTTWTTMVVRHHLAQWFQRTKEQALQMEEMGWNLVPSPSEQEASEEAQEVIRIALRPPPEVLIYAEERARNKQVKRTKPTKYSISRYLRDLGWPLQQIKEVFQEVRELL